MGADTEFMTWKHLKDKLDSNLTKDTFKELCEQEEYMKTKGFTFKINEVISPTGETLWKRTHY